MFKLTRYYAISSFLCVIVAAAALGMFYRQVAMDSLMTVAEKRNQELTQVFSRALWPHFTPLLTLPATDTGDAVERLRRETVALMRDTAAIKIKIYNMDGLTVFSTEARQIGESKLNNAGFQTAAKGRMASELTHRDTFSAFENRIENRDVFSSYIPFVREKGGRVEGVFELYYDVTPFLGKVQQTQRHVVLVVLVVLAVLYGLLFLVVRRAQLIIDKQGNELNRSLATIEESNRQLDQRVNERTAQLAETNRALQAKMAEHELAEERLRLSAKVFESTIEGVIIADADGKILVVNNAFTQVTGYPEAEVLHQTPRILKSGRHEADFYAGMWKSLGDKGQWAGEIWNRRKNGEIYPQWLTISAVTDAAGSVRNYVGVFSDISEIKRSQERLEFLAHHDQLTQLPNRLLFNSELNHSISLARRQGRQLALLYIDLDNFKHVNDTLGHDIGDELLKIVAAHLAAHVRKSDQLARLGGDEFILLLEDVEVPRYAAAIAQKIIALLNRPVIVSGYELFVTASIGVSLFPNDGEDAATLMKNADTAMYHAKTHGRNACHFYASTMSEYARERIHLEALLRHAIERGELFLHYQPQVDLASGALVGAEALLRWSNPELGMVSPVRFIPIAEDIGMISIMGEWVLREACRQVKEWDAQGLQLPRIAVNLSVRQMEHGNIVDIVTRTLAETGLDASRLEMEVTESAIMQNEHALEFLDGLRALGVELAIDDFGTGYSSLSYLRRLPVQKLKIDRSFITDVTSEPSREAIVRAVIAMGQALGLCVIAEGIETEAEAQFLTREHCQQGQGYLYSKPVAPADLLARWRDTGKLA